MVFKNLDPVLFLLFPYKIKIMEQHFIVWHQTKPPYSWQNSKERTSDNAALTLALDPCQRASRGLKPRCVPVGSLLVQYITRGQDTAEE